MQTQTIGEEIKQLRRNLDLTQAGLAAMIKSSPASVAWWEGGHGKPRPIFKQRIFLLAKSHGVPNISERPLVSVGNQNKTPRTYMTGRKTKVTLYTINKILQSRGQEILSKADLIETPELEITRSQIKQMKRTIEQYGFACIRRLKGQPGKCEFVNPRSVQIKTARFSTSRQQRFENGHGNDGGSVMSLTNPIETREGE